MPDRDDDLLLADMLDCSEAIFSFTANLSYEEFVKDRKTVDAVVRNFEVIGEAAGMISKNLKMANAEVEWRLMSDFRNVLIHNYFGIDFKTLWTAVTESLPYNYRLLKQIII